MLVTIINTNGSSLGPYNIYYDAVDPGLLLASNVSAATLTAGIELEVTDTATTIIVVNTRTGCGSSQQVINLPPPVTPVNYDTVTIRAKLAQDGASPITASLYYKVDTSSYVFLGTFDSASCTTFSTIPVPTNSTLYIGILSASSAVEFGATGSNAACTGTPLITEYCGITTPFSLRVSGSVTVNASAKVLGGVIALCNVPPPPPPPPPVDPANPTVDVKGSNTGEVNTRINLTVTRVRSGSSTLLYQVLDTNVLLADTFDQTTIPNVLGDDIIQVQLDSANIPLSEVTLIVYGGATSGTAVQIYRTPAYSTNENFSFTIPSTGDSYFRIEAYSA